MSLPVPMPLTLMERLAMLVGQPVTVYLMGVHARVAIVPPNPAWTAQAEEEPAILPPRPGPRPPCPPKPPCPPPQPPMPPGTAIVIGILMYAGTDYLAVRVGSGTATCRDYLIPYNALGMVIPGIMPL